MFLFQIRQIKNRELNKAPVGDALMISEPAIDSVKCCIATAVETPINLLSLSSRIYAKRGKCYDD
jgi:hypothetical protein